MHLDHVPSRPSNRRNDRHFAFRNPIEKRRLASVRRPGNGDYNSFAQALPAIALHQHRGNVALKQTSNLQRWRHKILRHVRLIRKIDACLNESKRLDQLRTPILRPVSQRSSHLPKGLAALPFRFGFNEVSKAFNRSQIELAILKSTTRELARLRRTQAIDLRECSKDRRNDGTASM